MSVGCQSNQSIVDMPPKCRAETLKIIRTNGNFTITKFRLLIIDVGCQYRCVSALVMVPPNYINCTPLHYNQFKIVHTNQIRYYVQCFLSIFLYCILCSVDDLLVLFAKYASSKSCIIQRNCGVSYIRKCHQKPSRFKVRDVNCTSNLGFGLTIVVFYYVIVSENLSFMIMTKWPERHCKRNREPWNHGPWLWK